MTTRETIDLDSALRVQHIDRLESFLRDKLFLDVYKSVSHRKSALVDAGELTDTIISLALKLHTNGVIDRALLVSTVHDVLKRFDTAAGVAYAAHHK